MRAGRSGGCTSSWKFRTEKRDRKSTRLNSSHSQISYAVFCLKKKKHDQDWVQAVIQQPKATASTPASPEFRDGMTVTCYLVFQVWVDSLCCSQWHTQ